MEYVTTVAQLPHLIPFHHVAQADQACSLLLLSLGYLAVLHHRKPPLDLRSQDMHVYQRRDTPVHYQHEVAVVHGSRGGIIFFFCETIKKWPPEESHTGECGDEGSVEVAEDGREGSNGDALGHFHGHTGEGVDLHESRRLERENEWREESV